MGTEPSNPPPSTRRDFLVLSAAAYAAVGGMLALWPFVAQMNPQAGAPAPDTLDVDISPIAPGQTIVVAWRGQPIFIRRRLPADVASARAAPVASLVDASARNDALPVRAPATDDNRTVAGHAEWLVVVGLCTHMNCVLKSDATGVLDDGEGFACPCHNARFDHAGRVVKGPATTNLAVPKYSFPASNTIRLG